MINFEQKLFELEDCLKQIAEAIYYNSAAIEKCNRDIKLHHSLGDLNNYIDSRQEMDRLSTREANLMKEKQLLLIERGFILELMCKNITEDNPNRSEEFIAALVSARLDSILEKLWRQNK